MAVHRLVNKADFERLLACRSRGRSAHFALHHVAGAPAPAGNPARLQQSAADTKLSTALAPNCPQPVDDFQRPGVAPGGRAQSGTRPHGVWFGCVVPKRHARRAVTRTLLKRQLRSAFERHAGSLPAGLWLLRLRAPFAKAEFVSARSAALAAAARVEIDGLLRQAAG